MTNLENNENNEYLNKRGSWEESNRRFKVLRLRKALVQSRGNRTMAAKMVGIDRMNLHRLLDEDEKITNAIIDDKYGKDWGETLNAQTKIK